MKLKIDHAMLTDIDALLSLYFTIYGNSYPLAIGTDPKAMADAIVSQDFEWLLMRDESQGRIAGSLVFELDRSSKIAKAMALAVLPEYRSQGIASRLLSVGSERVLSAESPIHSIYTTTRTVTVGPQRVFFNDGYLPLGIFPNAHLLEDYESLTLFAKFKPGVLERRAPLPPIPEKLVPIYSVVNSLVSLPEEKPAPLRIAPSAPIDLRNPHLAFETIHAPQFVLRRFNQTFTDPYDRFYPFHEPNFLAVATDGSVEIYGHFSPKDRYCAVVGLTQPIYELAGKMPGFFRKLRELGVSYIEVLISIEHTRSIETLLESHFVPSAIYPAMQEEADGTLRDFVLMSRTLEPLNFRGMALDQRFKPYIDQYVELWKKMNLETIEVFDGCL